MKKNFLKNENWKDAYVKVCTDSAAAPEGYQSLEEIANEIGIDKKRAKVFLRKLIKSGQVDVFVKYTYDYNLRCTKRITYYKLQFNKISQDRQRNVSTPPKIAFRKQKQKTKKEKKKCK